MKSKNWVLMRGLARSAAHWGPFREKFKAAFPDDSFEFLDARGNGSLVDQKSFLRISDYVDDLRRRCAFLAKAERVNIVAISMGGMMAVDWATRHPGEVESIICMNTSDGGSSHVWQRLRPMSVPTLLGMIKARARPIERETLALDLGCNLLTDHGALLEEFSQLPITKAENFFRQLFAASKFRFPKVKPSQPVLLLGSEGDRLCSIQCTKNIARNWGIDSTIHPTAGHDLPLDAPDWAVEKIKLFSAKLRADQNTKNERA